jgi:hypothetical protein
MEEPPAKLARTEVKGRLPDQHEKDCRITMRQKDHVYVVDEVCWPVSVSTIAKWPFEPFNADNAIKVMRADTRNSKYPGKTDDEIKAAWEENRQIAAERGTRIHYGIEQCLRSGEWGTRALLPTESIQSDEFAPQIAMAQKFVKEYIIGQGMEIVRVEARVFMEIMSPDGVKAVIPGTIDMIFWDPVKKKHGIVDWKCSAKLQDEGFKCGLTEAFSKVNGSSLNIYFIQLLLYMLILETYDIEVDISQLIIVNCHANNTSYQAMHAPAWMYRLVKQELVERYHMYLGLTKTN